MKKYNFAVSNLINIVLFMIIVFCWIVINASDLKRNEFIRNVFTDSYWVLPMFGSLTGLLIAKQWGGLKSYVGKTLTYLSLGLLCQTLGQIVYAMYYFILKIEVPYPSLGDVFYFSSVLAYIASAWNLAETLGVRRSLLKNSVSIATLVLPIMLLIVTYRIMLGDYSWSEANTFKLIMDFGQPFGQAIYISLVLLVLYVMANNTGHRMHKAVLLSIGAFVLQYIADFYYSYQATYNTWEPAGLNDLMYVVAYFVTTLAIIEFANAYSKFLTHQQH